MRFCSTLLLLFFFSSFAFSQTITSVLGGGGRLDDAITAVATDAAGNYITAGYFTGPATYADTILTGQPGVISAFVAKHNAAGNRLWHLEMPHQKATQVTNMSADAAGNVYVTGLFYETLQLGTFTLQSYNGYRSTFLVKLNPAGQVQWAQAIGIYFSALDLAPDAAGNLYVSANFNNTVNVGGTVLTSIGGSDIAVVKFDPQGQVLWARQAGSAGNDSAPGIATDAAGNCIVIGKFTAVAQFGNQSITSAGKDDAFLAKYDASGNLLWVKAGGGNGNDFASCVATDQQGNIIWSGSYTDQFTYSTVTLTSNGNPAFLLILDSNGNPLLGETFGSNNNGNYCKPNAIAMDSAGDIYLGGATWGGNADFGGISSAGAPGQIADGFVVKFAPSGQAKWLFMIGGSLEDYVSGLAISSSGTVYAGGTFNSSYFNYMGTGPLTNTSQVYKYDLFLATIAQTVGTAEAVSAQALQLYPNPSAGAVVVSQLPAGARLLLVRDALGRQVHRQNIMSATEDLPLHLGHLPEGMYLLEVQTTGSRLVRKLVLQR